MFRKTLISILFLILLAPFASAACGDADATCITGAKKSCTYVDNEKYTGGDASCKADCSGWNENTCIAPKKSKIKPPRLIGGTLLPGTQESVQEQIQADSSAWLQNTFFSNLIDQLIGWTAALAVIFLIIGGYQYLTAIGNEEQIKQAHKTIIWSLVGVLISLLAFAIVQILVNINFETTKSDLLAANVSDILPFAEPGWNGDEAIRNLPKAEFKEEFLPVVARFLIYGMAFLAFLVFFASGAWLVVGWGEDESVKKAKNAIIWSITGLAFAAASYALVKGLLGVDLSW